MHSLCCNITSRGHFWKHLEQSASSDPTLVLKDKTIQVSAGSLTETVDSVPPNICSRARTHLASGDLRGRSRYETDSQARRARADPAPPPAEPANPAWLYRQMSFRAPHSRSGHFFGLEQAANLSCLGQGSLPRLDDARVRRSPGVGAHLLLPRRERGHEMLVLRPGMLLEPAVRREALPLHTQLATAQCCCSCLPSLLAREGQDAV